MERVLVKEWEDGCVFQVLAHNLKNLDVLQGFAANLLHDVQWVVKGKT